MRLDWCTAQFFNLDYPVLTSLTFDKIKKLTVTGIATYIQFDSH